ncbi:MAG: DUF4129 domain-containing protein [Terriglobia bacterium]|jgi:hypothetical protein
MTRTSLFAILILSLATCALARQAANTNPSATLDLQGYTAELARWSASASRLRLHPDEAAALRKQLPDHWTVAVEEQRFLVSTKWLGNALANLAANPRLATETSQEMGDRLEAMRQDSQTLAKISGLNSTMPRTKLDDILKRREFRSVRASNQVESLWDRLVDWVWGLIAKLFNRMGSHPVVATALLWGVVVALSLIFLGWLIYSLTHLSLANLSFRRPPAPMEGAPPPGNWEEWAERVRASAARGDYREAIRIIYGAAVRRIEEAGTWHVDPSRTHREYVRLLPADSLQRPALVAITTCFERVWYGNAQASSADYEIALAELESLR